MAFSAQKRELSQLQNRVAPKYKGRTGAQGLKTGTVRSSNGLSWAKKGRVKRAQKLSLLLTGL